MNENTESILSAADETQNPPKAFSNDSDTFFPESDIGFLRVRAETANGSLPVSEAAVIISSVRNGEESVVSFQLTDKSGLTPAVALPAPPKADSQTPDSRLPFSDYTVTVRHPMYYTEIFNDAQIFGGETTFLSAELTPLPEYVNERDITRTTDIPRQNL